MLPGGCQVVIGHKLKVLESLVKGVFCPLAPRGGVWGDPPPILGHTWLGVCRTCGCGTREACNSMRHIYLIQGFFSPNMHKFLEVLSGVQQTPMGLAEGRGKFGMETSRPLVAELS